MIKRYFNIFVALIVATLFATSCQNERTLDLYEEGEMTVDVSFYVKDFDVVQLRSHLRPEDEHAIEDLAIWVFDRAGNRYGDVLVTSLGKPKAEDGDGFEALGTSPTSNDGSVGKGVDFGGTKQLGDISKLLKLRLKSTSDELTVVALANFKSANFALEDATTGDKYNTEEQFKKIKTLDDLKALRLNINQGNDEYTTTLRFESPLMYAVRKVTVDDVRSRLVKIPLIPYIAKYTATVKAGSPNVTINSISIHFENIPTQGNLFNAVTKEQLPVTDLNLRNTHEEFMAALSDGSFVNAGYLMPNYAKPKAQITKEIVAQAQARKKGNGTGYTAFDLRQKRVKEDAAGGYVENKGWQYAPDEATALVIDAELTLKEGEKEQRAIATYTVLLGDFSGVSSWEDPTEEDLLKINNYLIESATHYKYNITINGVDNIIVEAESTDKLDEPNPSVEGTVIGNKPTFVLDSHYEQRTFLLSSTDFDIFKDPNTRELKDDAKLQFMVQTPFEPLKLVTYTRSEAERARMDGVPEDKVVDNDWIRIYVHDPAKHNQVFDNNNLPQILYSQTRGDVEKGTSEANFWEKTLTVEQFFAWVLENPTPLFDQKNAICITMFVDEYFYQWDPKKVKKEDRTSANADRDLWKTFCNAPDRKFFLLTGDLKVSADQNSHFTEGTYLSVAQHSIKTIFTKTADGLRIWGVESIDEHPNRRFIDALPTSSAMWGNIYYSNGWSNTWNLLAGDITPPVNTTDGKDAGWIKGGTNLIMKQRRNNGHYKEDNYWSEMTIGTANGVDMRDTKNYQAVYSPLSRNRDVNRDDKMQASELKWYIPAANEVMILALAESFLPAYAKLDVKRTESNLRDYPNAPLVVHSSLAFRNNAVAYTSYNPMVFLPESFCHLPVLDVLKDPSFYKKGDLISYANALDNFYSTTRLIRDLGVVEDEVTEIGTTYHMREGERTENLNTFVIFKPKYDNPSDIPVGQSDRASGEFIGGVHFPAATRISFVDGELPTHTEKDTSIRLYKKGFKVAGSFAYINSSSVSAAERYTISYDDLKTKLLFHNSPCKGYYEESDRSDLGKWRLPNIMELGLMGLAMPRDYWFTVHEAFNGTTKKYIWSATTPSFAMSERSRSTYSNLFLYIDQQLFWTMNFKVNAYGVPASKDKGYVRCVRDIED